MDEVLESYQKAMESIPKEILAKKKEDYSTSDLVIVHNAFMDFNGAEDAIYESILEDSNSSRKELFEMIESEETDSSLYSAIIDIVSYCFADSESLAKLRTLVEKADEDTKPYLNQQLAFMESTI